MGHIYLRSEFTFNEFCQDKVMLLSYSIFDQDFILKEYRTQQKITSFIINEIKSKIGEIFELLNNSKISPSYDLIDGLNNINSKRLEECVPVLETAVESSITNEEYDLIESETYINDLKSIKQSYVDCLKECKGLVAFLKTLKKFCYFKKDIHAGT